MSQKEGHQTELPFSDPPPKNVLGDNQPTPLSPHQDTLGRGRKGHAHGSIAYKTVTRPRKNRPAKTYQQAWYQWQDPTGKHCRYLTQSQTRQVRAMLDRGATIPEILTALDHIRDTAPTQLQLIEEPTPN